MSGGAKLFAGHIEPPVGGLPGQLTKDSMAAAIYDEMAKYMPVGPTEDIRFRQWVAVAIAVGVIKHLQANINAFDIDVRDTAGAATRNPTITVDVT